MDYFDEDIQLMLRFQDGEEPCFEELVERHKTRVFALTYRFLGNYHEAEDAAQEIFIKVYRAKYTYKPTAKFTTWLYVICKNTCLKVLRHKRLHAVSINDPKELEEDAVAPQIADPHASSPSDSMLHDEQALVVKQAIDSLPANQKMAVILSRYDELSYENIAKVMSCSVKAVKSLLHRAKLHLREKLRDYVKNGN